MFRLRSTVVAACSQVARRWASNVLVVAEHDNKNLKAATLSAVSAAKALGGKISVLVAGKDCKQVAEKAAKIADVQSVLVADEGIFEHGQAEPLAPLISRCQKTGGFTHIVGAATAFGKNVIPRVAALLDTQPVGDVIMVKSADTFVRPIYAGNALATVKSSETVKVLTVRPASFERAAVGSGNAAISTVPSAPEDAEMAALSTFERVELNESSRPELGSARIVVSGGRALQSKETFDKIMNALCDAFGSEAAVGASRAACDAGYASNDLQVGQTGKVVAPDLYVAVGISGAIQHLAGMKDSKVIVVINKDPEAPFFQVADYGLVADLYQAVPELVKQLKASK